MPDVDRLVTRMYGGKMEMRVRSPELSASVRGNVPPSLFFSQITVCYMSILLFCALHSIALYPVHGFVFFFFGICRAFVFDLKVEIVISRL